MFIAPFLPDSAHTPPEGSFLKPVPMQYGPSTVLNIHGTARDAAALHGLQACVTTQRVTCAELQVCMPTYPLARMTEKSTLMVIDQQQIAYASLVRSPKSYLAICCKSDNPLLTNNFARVFAQFTALISDYDEGRWRLHWRTYSSEQVQRLLSRHRAPPMQASAMMCLDALLALASSVRELIQTRWLGSKKFGGDTRRPPMQPDSLFARGRHAMLLFNNCFESEEDVRHNCPGRKEQIASLWSYYMDAAVNPVKQSSVPFRRLAGVAAPIKLREALGRELEKTFRPAAQHQQMQGALEEEEQPWGHHMQHHFEDEDEEMEMRALGPAQ